MHPYVCYSIIYNNQDRKQPKLLTTNKNKEVIYIDR